MSSVLVPETADACAVARHRRHRAGSEKESPPTRRLGVYGGRLCATDENGAAAFASRPSGSRVSADRRIPSRRGARCGHVRRGRHSGSRRPDRSVYNDGLRGRRSAALVLVPSRSDLLTPDGAGGRRVKVPFRATAPTPTRLPRSTRPGARVLRALSLQGGKPSTPIHAFST